MDIEYRPAQRADVDGVYFVEASCFRVPWSLDAIHYDLCDNPDAVYVVAVAGGRVVGFTGMHTVVDEGHVMNMAVLEEYRKQGVGQRLMETLFALTPAKVRSYTLEVRRSNDAATRLYRRLGFYGVGYRRGYYTNPPEDALVMWRTEKADRARGRNTP
jgi:ribosomal-protein-alanine acetyltransferase